MAESVLEWNIISKDVNSFRYVRILSDFQEIIHKKKHWIQSGFNKNWKISSSQPSKKPICHNSLPGKLAA